MSKVRPARPGPVWPSTGQSPTAPLGHFVLAEVAMRAGRLDEAARELERGKSLEARASRSR